MSLPDEAYHQAVVLTLMQQYPTLGQIAALIYQQSNNKQQIVELVTAYQSGGNAKRRAVAQIIRSISGAFLCRMETYFGVKLEFADEEQTAMVLLDELAMIIGR